MKPRTASIATVLGVFVLGGPVLAVDWTNWRGPNHDGISSEKGFKKTWDSPPKVLWESPVGSAFSSFACVGGRAYTCGTKNKHQVLFCLDADTGKVIWEKPIEKELRERQGGDGTRTTPTVHEGRVYIFGAFGTLMCLDAKTNAEIWRKTFNNKPHWAYSGSVLIEGDMAIVSPGRSDGALIALDKKTGKQIWKSGSDAAGYATPYPFSFEGTRYIGSFQAKTFIIVEAKTGRGVCTIPWKTSYSVNASQPIYHDGHLFLSSGYSTGCGLYKLFEKADELEARLVWRNEKTMLTKFTSCVLKDGILYAGDQRGLKCIRFQDGKECWSVRGLPNATVLLADDHLIVFSEKGELLVAKATPDAFKPIAKTKVLSGRCWTVPTLYGGKLYVRNLKKAACVDLRAGS
jgi:outer membrane protein assembly factor BamB